MLVSQLPNEWIRFCLQHPVTHVKCLTRQRGRFLTRAGAACTSSPNFKYIFTRLRRPCRLLLTFRLHLHGHSLYIETREHGNAQRGTLRLLTFHKGDYRP